jgi:glycosyltransferase involved in cell wall biosynthesis
VDRLVSVVMAAYDAEATIGDAVRSVVEQTHTAWELIVVDDGSTDGTVAAVRAFRDERIHVIESEHVGVLAPLRNRAIAAAHGEWIALLDADDAWLPEKLERQLAMAGEAGVVHTGAYQLVGARREPAPVQRPPDPLFPALVENNFVYSSSALIRRSLLDRHGAFDQDPALWGSPDYELWLRLAPVAEFVYVDEPLLLYRVHGGQMSADARRMSLGTLAALEKTRLRFPDLVEQIRPLYDRRVGMLRCVARLPGRGRRDLLRAIRHRPGDLVAWKWLLRGLAPF